MEGAESTRISIRKRGAALGQHTALEKEERFTSWQHEEMARLTWTLGAMAAEHVFYGENSIGVGGDVMSATARAAWMVGACGMGPERVELNGRRRKKATEEEREQVMKRFESIGKQIMRRTGAGGPFEHDPIASVLQDAEKRAAAAQLLGQAFVSAHALVAANREDVERVAEAVIERKEIYGDELVELLESCDLVMPEVDLRDEAAWPKV
jgi:ATP-dependent Zn protease